MKPRLATFLQTTLASSIAMMFVPAMAQQATPAPAAAASAPGTAASAPAAKTAATLNAVTVTGYRASLDRAAEVKRNSNSIVDAISAEDIGKFPDRNAAESLAHLPGISVDRQFGEGEKVSINGTDPALNRVLINGQTIASGDWGGNPTDTSGRTFNYTLLSPEIIGLMEVFKSPEARIDEGSIGGTVIIHTRRPLDLPNNTIRGSLGYNYNDRSDEGSPRASLLGSWKSEDGKLGFLAAVSHDKQNISRAGIEFFGYTTGVGTGTSRPTTITGDAANVTTARIPVGINSSYFQQERRRDGLQSALQWKINDNNEINVTGIYVKGKYDNFSQSRYVCPGCGDLDKLTAVNVSNGLITSGTVTAGAGNGNQPYAQLDTNLRLSEVKTQSLNLQHDLTLDGWKLTSQVGTTRATGGKNPEYLQKFLLQSGGYNFNYDGTNTGVTYDNNTAANWGLPAAPAGSAPGAQIGGQYQAGGIEYTTTTDKEKYLQFDVTHDVEWGPVKELMFGVKYIDHTNGQVSRGNRINTTSAISLTQFSPGTTPGGLYDGLNASNDLVNWPVADRDAVLRYLLGQPQGEFTEKKGQFFNVNETTKNAYVQGNYEMGKFRGNVGLRYVNTNDDSTYYQTTTGGEPYTLVTTSKSYSRVLPSFNLAYDLDSDKVLRFAVAKVLARPRYSDLAGQTSLDNSRNSGSGGNPNLKPYESTNVDMGGEWYFQPGSLLGVELFYKDIKNYIVNTTSEQQLLDTDSGQIETFSISSPVNARKATVRGISLIYQQALPWGFGFISNVTHTRPTTSSDLNLPYSSRNTISFIPYWEEGPFSVRLAYNYRTEYFNQIGRLNSKVFADAYKQLDLTGSYEVSKNVSINVSATNLLDSTYYWYNEVKYAPIGTYKSGRTLLAGINFKL